MKCCVVKVSDQDIVIADNTSLTFTYTYGSQAKNLECSARRHFHPVNIKPFSCAVTKNVNVKYTDKSVIFSSASSSKLRKVIT